MNNNSSSNLNGISSSSNVNVGHANNAGSKRPFAKLIDKTNASTTTTTTTTAGGQQGSNIQLYPIRINQSNDGSDTLNALLNSNFISSLPNMKQQQSSNIKFSTPATTTTTSTNSKHFIFHLSHLLPIFFTYVHCHF